MSGRMWMDESIRGGWVIHGYVCVMYACVQTHLHVPVTI